MNQQTQFKSGSIVYDKRGNSAIYERPAIEGHIVFPQLVMGWGDEDATLDRTIWREVLAEPPAPSVLKFWIITAFIAGLFFWLGLWLLIELLKGLPA